MAGNNYHIFVKQFISLDTYRYNILTSIPEVGEDLKLISSWTLTCPASTGTNMVCFSLHYYLTIYLEFYDQ